MLDTVIALLRAFRSTLRTRRDLAMENLALRQQLIVAKRHLKRSSLTNVDRLFWVALARYWPRWRDVITIVKPATVVAWHRRGFRYYWMKKSASKPGRPRIARELLDLIRKMSLSNPTSAWTGQQILEAFPWDTAPKYLLRDRDGIYRGAELTDAVKSTGAKELKSAPRSPWQNPYVERLIGSIRRECLDHVIVFNERHLRRVLTRYFDDYHRSRTHPSLGKDAPETRPVEVPDVGAIRAVPQVGGLHHRYTRTAA